MEVTPDEDGSLDRNSIDYPVRQERSIFRREAYQHYMDNREKVIFPRLISERLFALLWTISLLLVVLGLLIAFWPVIEQLWCESDETRSSHTANDTQ